jgi:hypothetical protein
MGAPLNASLVGFKYDFVTLAGPGARELRLSSVPIDRYRERQFVVLSSEQF